VSALPANRNGAWDSVLAATLVTYGVRRVLLCPGGRAAMLSMTLHRTPAIDCILHVDERSAGFLALGMMLVDGAPAAVCTTSGTAVANVLPAMAEAEARGLPLVLLTCDRPQAGRLPGEPQWMPHVPLCAPLARSQLALPDPLDGRMTLAELRDRLAAALAQGVGGERPGPVHINIPQWGVYCSTEDDPASDEAPPVIPAPPPAYSPQRRLADVAAVKEAVRRSGVRKGARGLVLACEDQPLPLAAVLELLDATGYPLIADIGSGLRQFDLPGALTTADALAEGGALDIEDAEILIRLGGAPVCPGLLRAVKRLKCPVIRIARHDPGADFLSPGAVGLRPPSPAALTALAATLGKGDMPWAQSLRQAEIVAAAARDVVLATAAWGEMAAAGQICAAPGFAALHCANSLSVRHAGLVMPAGGGAARVFTARGVNGIDGTLGLVLGEALAGTGRMLALIGDQAFVHDLPALANPLWRQVRGALCVMNNAGGGIFELTAARRIDGYEMTMRNTPAVAFDGVARAFGLVHRPCADVAALDAALAEAAQADALSLIEIRTPAGTPTRDLPSLVGAMAASVRAACSLYHTEAWATPLLALSASPAAS
jgi:2-succinyl-5-enolpyruvyl-6-hydroxy-3-cyclohexene-1-carboxylate synthase